MQKKVSSTPIRRYIVLASLAVTLVYAWWRLKNRPLKRTYPHPESLIRPFAPEDNADRVIPLEAGINFRDIGGYHTADGRITQWGKIYRSGDLSKLTDGDIATLEQLNLKLICDLRTNDERQHGENRLPQNVHLHYQHTPIYEAPDRSPKWLIKLFSQRHQIEKLWIEEVYIKRFVEERAAAFGRVITLLADETHYPAVVHCTAGKDRTGLTIALILALLNVPDQTIIADYTYSNRYYTQILQAVSAEARRLALFGIDTPDLFPLLTADEKVITAALQHIRHTYGSIENYLMTKAAVSPETIAQLRHNLLTP